MPTPPHQPGCHLLGIHKCCYPSRTPPDPTCPGCTCRRAEKRLDAFVQDIEDAASRPPTPASAPTKDILKKLNELSHRINGADYPNPDASQLADRVLDLIEIVKAMVPR